MSNPANIPKWGNPPWHIDFHSESVSLPDKVDFAIVGGGFTGCATAAWLCYLAPTKSVALFEVQTIGSGASGHTGGMTLDGTAVGELPGLGDVLAGFSRIVQNLGIYCDLTLPGALELGRNNTRPGSSVDWKDSGDLRVADEVPGGTCDPGKLVSGLARAAAERGAQIFEHAAVSKIEFEESVVLHVNEKRVRADRVLIATNAKSLELSNLVGRAQPKFTLALATEALSDDQLQTLGVASGKPFYTVDLPYLWGRLLHGNRIIFGSGLVHVNDWRELDALDIAEGQAAELLGRLECRVRGLHPVLRNIHFDHRWGGPILIAEEMQPVFAHHSQSPRVIILGAYSGHGVALSVYLGAWAAEAMLGQRELPNWNSDQ